MPDWLLTLRELPAVTTLLRIGLIAGLAYAAYRGMGLLARKLENRLSGRTANSDDSERLKTLVRVGRGVAVSVLALVAGLIILEALGVDVVPLLAGAGVVGLAISLGAQTLVKDYISGMLILVEGQFSVGDTIRVDECQGEVERMTLRATFLRDLEGRQHIVPNGEIRTVANLTVGWSRAVVDLNVPFDADMSVVIRALEAAIADAQRDPTTEADLLEAPQVMGWNAFQDWALQVRLLAKTRPGKQWETARTLRKCALQALESAGVQLALPRQEVRLQAPGTSSEVT